jgi:hypothetical protein
LASLATEDEQMVAERISADHLLPLRRQPVEAAAQINRTTGEEDLRARSRLITPTLA